MKKTMLPTVVILLVFMLLGCPGGPDIPGNGGKDTPDYEVSQEMKKLKVWSEEMTMVRIYTVKSDYVNYQNNPLGPLKLELNSMASTAGAPYSPLVVRNTSRFDPDLKSFFYYSCWFFEPTSKEGIYLIRSAESGLYLKASDGDEGTVYVDSRPMTKSDGNCAFSIEVTTDANGGYQFAFANGKKLGIDENMNFKAMTNPAADSSAFIIKPPFRQMPVYGGYFKVKNNSGNLFLDADGSENDSSVKVSADGDIWKVLCLGRVYLDDEGKTSYSINTAFQHVSSGKYMHSSGASAEPLTNLVLWDGVDAAGLNGYSDNSNTTFGFHVVNQYDYCFSLTKKSNAGNTVFLELYGENNFASGTNVVLYTFHEQPDMFWTLVDYKTWE